MRFLRHRARRALIGILAGIAALSVVPPAHSQYTANFQTNTFSGVTNIVLGSYIVGSNSFADVLLIQNSGLLAVGAGFVGYEATSSNNSVVVAGANAFWKNAFTSTIGMSGSNNRLTITNAGLVTASNLLISATASASNNLVVVDGGTLQVTNVTVGELGAGQLIVSNGLMTSRLLYIGSNALSVGTLTLVNGTISNTATITLAAQTNATGTLWVKGGLLQMTSNSIFIGRAGIASMTVSDGVVQVPGIFVSSVASSHGTLTQAGGTLLLRASMTVGGITNTSAGAVWITGGQFIATNGVVQAGGAGAGQITISNTAIMVSNLVSRDTINIVGGTVTYRSVVDVSGPSLIAGPPRIASLSLMNGAITATGPIDEAVMDAGVFNPGFVVVSNATVTTGSAVIGYIDGNGTLTFNGGSIVLSTNLLVGVSGTGTLWIANGQLVETNTAVLLGSSGPATVTVSNGVVDFADLKAGRGGASGVATLTFAGGTMRVSSSVTLGDCATGARGILSIGGG